MSNIRITDNGSGKYSPDWFYNEAQIPRNAFLLLIKLMNYKKNL